MEDTQSIFPWEFALFLVMSSDDEIERLLNAMKKWRAFDEGEEQQLREKIRDPEWREAISVVTEHLVGSHKLREANLTMAKTFAGDYLKLFEEGKTSLQTVANALGVSSQTKKAEPESATQRKRPKTLPKKDVGKLKEWLYQHLVFV